MFTVAIFITGIYTAAYAQQLSSNTIGVKITSPIKDQRVPVGRLTISGTSTHNTTSDCQVSVIVNNVKPYQNATATGSGGNNDYSKWNFMLSPQYTMIKEGTNKITSKLVCADNPNLKKFYSVNITGVAASNNNNKTVQQQQQTVITPQSPPPSTTTTTKNNNNTSSPLLLPTLNNSNQNIQKQQTVITPPPPPPPSTTTTTTTTKNNNNTSSPLLLPTPTPTTKNSNNSALLPAITQIDTSPTANAGPDKAVIEGDKVTLDGGNSSDPDGSIVSSSWKQISGSPSVKLKRADSVSPSFTAPFVKNDTPLTFQLTVTDNNGRTSNDTVNILVKDK
jgi:K319-like protein